MRVRKKPVEVDAELLTGFNGQELVDWITSLGGDATYERAPFESMPSLRIRTLEGSMRADEGDWVIRGVAGEFYPCKPEIFEATYEPVSEPEQ